MRGSVEKSSVILKMEFFFWNLAKPAEEKNFTEEKLYVTKANGIRVNIESFGYKYRE